MGNKPLKKQESIITPETIHCMCCNKEYDSNKFYSSDSLQYKSIGKLPYCSDCIDDIYQSYIKEFTKAEYRDPDRKAMQRLCMAFDVYYSDKLYESALSDFKKNTEKNKNQIAFIGFYFKHVKLYQYRKKNYNSSIFEEFQIIKNEKDTVSVFSSNDSEEQAVIKKAKRLFGDGFSDDSYLFLQEQYDDWTARNECQTKAQEELFKQLSFIQLDLLKARQKGEDTKDLMTTFQKTLDAGKLQPKQNSGDVVSETQTFGTLLDKWEKERPLPDIDEDLKDVDKIGRYLDIFFRGHLAKMMGLKNGLSNLYTQFMKKYTVEKPEYEDNEDGEALFDAIFGNSNIEDI